jgi:Large polyvalent protein associated domain 39/Transglycosylase SLT domain
MADTGFWSSQEGSSDRGFWSPQEEAAPASPSYERPEDTRSAISRISGDYTPLIEDASRKYGVDSRLLHGIIQSESSGNPAATGRDEKGRPAGRGLMQVTGTTGRGYGIADPEDLYDPATNIDTGTRVFRDFLDQAGGDVHKALRMYNKGTREAAYNSPEAHDYANKTLDHALRSDVGEGNSIADRAGRGDFMRGLSGGIVGTGADLYGERAFSALREGDLDSATSHIMEALKGQQYLQTNAKPQDMWSEVHGLGEAADWAQYNLGQMLGSSAPAAGYAAYGAGAGAVAGSVFPGAGNVVGAGAGAAYGLVSGLAGQYTGNSLLGAVQERLKKSLPPGKNPTHEDVRAALQQLTSSDLNRISASGLARGAVEAGSDIALAGLGKLIPGGKTVDLLAKGSFGTPAARLAGGAAVEAGSEMADVPLEAWGTGGDWNATDLENAGMAGLVGGVGVGGAGNARGVYTQARGVMGNEAYQPNYTAYARNEVAAGREPLSREDYAKAFYDKSAVQQSTNEGRPRLQPYAVMPTEEEQQRSAQEQDAREQAAEAERTRIPTAKELHQQMLAEHEAKLKDAKLPVPSEEEFYAATEKYENPEDLPPHLATFAAYKAYRKKTDKIEQAKRNAAVGPMPTMQDALKRRQEIIRDTTPKKTYVNKATGQMDMWGNEYGKGPVVAPEQESAAEDAGPDVRQGEIDYGPEPLALTDESASTALAKAKAATSPEEKRAWLNVAVKRYMAQQPASGKEQLQNTPTLADFQEVIDSLNTEQGKVESAQRAADTREAERSSLADSRNQAYDLLDQQKNAEKEAQFAEMERQRLEQDAKQQIAEGNRTAPEQSLINGKKPPTAFKTRPSVETAENLAAIEAQNKESARHNTLAQKVEEAKQRMHDAAVKRLQKEGVEVGPDDRLEWNPQTRAWGLFSLARRGRLPAGSEGFHLQTVYNKETDKPVGKVLRPDQPNPTKEQGNGESTNEPVSESAGTADQLRSAGSDTAARSDLGGLDEKGQSETNDAAQGQEVTHAEQNTETKSEGRAERDTGNGAPRKAAGAVGKQRKGKAKETVAEEAALASEIKRLEESQADGTLEDKDVDALIKKIQDIEAAKKKAEHDKLTEDAIAADANDYTDTKADGDSEPLDFNDVEWMASSKPAEGKVNADQIRSVIDNYQADFGDRLGIKFRFFESPEQAFGPDATVPQGVKGFYDPKSGTIGVFGGSVDSLSDLKETLDHEMFGHFGLNTLSPLEKFSLLARIARSQGNLFVKRAFDEVKADQPHLANNEFKVAEEVFARAAESVDDFWTKVWDAIASKVLPFLRDLGWVKSETSIAELRVMARKIAADIRSGEATQQNFPKEIDTQFRSASEDFSAFTDKVLDTSLGNAWGSSVDTLKNLVVGLNNTAFLAKWMPHMTSLQDIHTSETKMQASQGKNANAVMDKIDDVRNLQKPDRTKLFTLMVDSTRARIHPDRPLTDKTNAHIPDTPENQAAHRKLMAQYNALTPDARKAYQETRDLFQKMFDQRVKALFALSDRILTDKKREQFKENINRLTKEMPGPYFPLTRFGGFVSVWKSKDYAQAQKDHDTKRMEELKRDPNHYAVSFHGSKFQADRALKKKIAEMGDRSALGENESYAREREFYDGGVTMDLRPLLEKMQDAVETTLGKEESRDAKNALAEIFVASLADTNVLKSSLKRENIEGVKPEEMLQAIAKHGSAQAFHISRLEHMADIQDALKKLRNEDSVAVNNGEAFSVYNTVAKALTGMYTGDPTSFPVRMINSANFLLYNGRLALNPAFWLTNAMAPLMVSVPYMRGRFKLNAVLDAYKTATIDAAKVVMPRGLKDATRFSLLDAITNASDLKPGERAMLSELMDEGLIDENQIRELSNVAQGDIGWKDELSRYMGAIPHRVEALNRASTALTAYRLELARTKDQEAAVRYAIDATSETQVNYTTAGTPYILRKNGWLGAPAAKILTQFMRYQLGMGQLILHNLREAFISKTVDDKTREEARRKFYALLSMHTAMTGASGWFGINAFMAVAQMVANAFTDDDDEVDIEQEIKKLADGIFGKEISVGVRKGLPAMVGLDLSSRLGMGDMLSIRKENPFRGDVTDAKAKFVDMAPALSNLFNWYDWGRSGFAIKKTPIAFVSNLAKASELASKGMVNTHGVVKKGSEDYSPTSVVAQGLGFTPTESTEAYAAQNAIREKETQITAVRQNLLDTWNNAMHTGDQEKVAEARKKIVEFNSRHQGQRDILITPDTLTKSRKQRMSRQKRMNEYGVYIPKGGEWRNEETGATE